MKGKKLTFVLISIIIISLSVVEKSSADWHVGNRRLSAYGVKANIWTPTNPIYLEESGISNSVTTPLPYWIQAGWRYYVGYQAPQSYLEYNPPVGPYFGQNFSNHNWGSIVTYKVEHNNGNIWCCYIGDPSIEFRCAEIVSAPTDMIVQSEVHVNSKNELNTTFTNVYYKNSNGQWLVFDQDHWFENFPYYVHKDPPYTPYYFHTYRYRGTTLFLPNIVR